MPQRSRLGLACPRVFATTKYRINLRRSVDCLEVGLLLRILFFLSDPFNLPELFGTLGVHDRLVLQVVPLGGQDRIVLVETSRNGTGFALNDSSVSARGG